MNRRILSIGAIGILACVVLLGVCGVGFAGIKGKWKISGLTPRLLGKAEKNVKCPVSVVLEHEYFGVLRSTKDRFILLTNITNPASEDLEDFRRYQAEGGEEGLGGSQWVGMLVAGTDLSYPKLDKGEYMISFDADGGLSFYNKREAVKAVIPPEELEEIEGYHLTDLEYENLAARESKENTKSKMSGSELDHLQRYKLTSSIPRQTYFEAPAVEEGMVADFFDFKLLVPIDDDLLWLCGQLKPKPDGDITWSVVRE